MVAGFAGFAEGQPAIPTIRAYTLTPELNETSFAANAFEPPDSGMATNLNVACSISASHSVSLNPARSVFAATGSTRCSGAGSQGRGRSGTALRTELSHQPESKDEQKPTGE